MKNEDSLLRDHLGLVNSIINGFYVPPGLDREDLVQVGLMGIFKANKQYKSNKDTEFSTYAYKSAKNEILKLLDKQKKYMNESNPLLIEPIDESLPMEKCIVAKAIKKDLEQEEKIIIDLLYKGYTQREIAKVLDTTQPNICQRIRRLKIKYQRKWGNINDL